MLMPMRRRTGILEDRIDRTPIAVLDFETTGLDAGGDRVVEVCVVRSEDGRAPELVLDTLVNPGRRVGATEIHGISDADVADAPRFEEIAGDLAHALSGCVVAAYNVYFDIRFLEFELAQAGLPVALPHLCLMYMRPMLGMGRHCSLSKACTELHIGHTPTHTAAADTLASAELMGLYREQMNRLDLVTFKDLAKRRSYKFVSSWKRPMLDPVAVVGGFTPGAAHKSRSGLGPARPAAEIEAKRGLGLYWDGLKAVLANLDVTDEEIERLQRLKDEHGLSEERVRTLHARAFSNAIRSMAEDQVLDAQEQENLRRLREGLRRIGWAPGD